MYYSIIVHGKSFTLLLFYGITEKVFKQCFHNGCQERKSNTFFSSDKLAFLFQYNLLVHLTHKVKANLQLKEI